MKLQWRKATDEEHAHFFEGEFATNASYKIVKYGEVKEYPHGGWCSFFLPAGWKSFGNSCEHTNLDRCKHYKTPTQAKSACQRHFTKFGDKADQYKSIPNN